MSIIAVMSVKKINVGLVGFGVAAKFFHLPLLLKSRDFEVTAVMSSRKDEVAATVPRSQLCLDLASLLSLKPDLAIITAPTPDHYSVAKATIEAGVNTIVDKPFVTTVSQGEELIALAKSKGVLLSVYHNRRWDNDILTVKKLLDEGRLGDPYLFISRLDRFRPQVFSDRWREQAQAGSGVLFDIGSHLIDQALLLFGAATLLKSDLAIQREQGKVEDYFNLTLGFGKVRATLSASCFVQGEYNRLEIHGSKGSYFKKGLDPQENQARTGLFSDNPAWGVEPVESSGILATTTSTGVLESRVVSERGNYGEYYRSLAMALRTGTELPVTADSALEVIKIIELARKGSTNQL